MTGRVPAVAMAVVLCACGAAWGDTEVSGNFASDVTWTVAGSPYIVTGNVLVKSGATLTIEPGVTVAFDGSWKLETDSTSPLSSIVAQGTALDSIRFTSNLPSPGPTSWQHVSVSDSSSASAFSYCVFEYGARGLFLMETDAPIEHCSFRTCQVGIWLDDSSPAITSCNISDCTLAGILCQDGGTSPVIHECDIVNPAPDAMNVRLMSYLSFPVVTIDATLNWWGTSVPSEIEAKIFDIEDETAIHGTVNYDPYHSSPGVELSSWGSIKALFRD